MGQHGDKGSMMFPLAKGRKVGDLAEQANHGSGDGGDDEQEHHHRYRAVLVFIVQRRSKEAISGDGLNKTAGLFKLRRRSSRNALALSYITSHAPWNVAEVIALTNHHTSTSLIHRCPTWGRMERFDFALNERRIHLAVEGSTGGTSVGLHAAADTINAGKRVLWVSTEMPDPTRFSQLFEHLSLVESSRFHAMNFGGKFERAIDALLEATNSLPSVGLVVLDDWCPSSGRIEAVHLDQIERFTNGVPEGMTLLLISKGSIDASGSTTDPIVARASERMEKMGFEIWRLWRGERQQHRVLQTRTEAISLTLDDSGFHL